MGKPRPVLIDRLEREGYVTVPRASVLTDVAERSLRTWTRTGRVETRRVGGLVFVKLTSLWAAVGIGAAS